MTWATPVAVPVPVRLTNQPITTSHPIGWELAIGSVLAILLVAAVAIVGVDNDRGRMLPVRGRMFPVRGRVLPGSASWTFKDSWASNLTAALTAVGAVSAAFSDKFPDVIQERSILELGVGQAVLGLLVVLAPLAYSTFSTDPGQLDEGSVKGEPAPGGRGAGLLVSAALTLTGAFGSLTGILVCVIDAHISRGTKACVWLGCLLIAMLVAAYAYRSLSRLLNAAFNAENFVGERAVTRLKQLTGIVSISCCDETPTLTRMRVSLL